MNLLPLLERHEASFMARYGERISNEQRWALLSMKNCRTPCFGETLYKCEPCQQYQSAYHSCGHRSCPHCQQHDTTQWLARQQQKLLPVNYFMVTFTLPYQFRPLMLHHQKVLYALLFRCAVSTLQCFAKKSTNLGGDIGLTALLHTHTRKLDYHPHVHVIVPAGCVDKKRRQWRKLNGDYLFNVMALAKVFRARFIDGVNKLRLSIPLGAPVKWRVHCKSIGQGLPALTYLSRYLYRGVINENNLLGDDGKNITFRYKESQTNKMKTRSIEGADFIWLLLQHVLPKGFRRVRDYCYLHGNAKYLLRVIQLALGVIVPPHLAVSRPSMKCPCCQQPMAIIGFTHPIRSSP